MHHIEDPLFRTIFNQLPEPRLIVKADAPFFTIVCTNHAWQEVAEGNIKDLYGMAFQQVSEQAIGNDELRKIIQELLSQSILARKNLILPPYQLPLEIGNETEKWVQPGCTPIANDLSGEITYLICALPDVTKEIRNKNKLKLSRLNEAELLKEQHLLNQDLADINRELGLTNQALRKSQESLSQINRELEDRILERTRKLESSESRFRSLFEQAPIGMCFLTGEDLLIELVNEPMLKIWDCSLKEIIGIPYKTASQELGDHFSFDSLQKVYRSGETCVNNELKTKFFSKMGWREAYVNVIYHPLKDQNNNVTGLMIILSEITEWVVARQKAESIQDQLNLALESAELGTWYIDVDTREMIASKRLKEMFGFEPDNGITLEQYIVQINEDYRDTVLEAIDRTIKDGGRYEIEYPIYTDQEGKQRWIRATGKRFSGRDGKPDHFSGTALDITGRKMEEIRKNDFIAIASHELKTPLTSLKGYLQVMHAKAVQMEIPIFLNAVSRSLAQTERMHTLISSFLDMTRLEAKGLPLTFQVFGVYTLLRDMADEIEMFSPGYQIMVDPLQDFTVYADREKIQQVLSNLLSNAVKYSPKGKRIILNCRLTTSEAVFSVKDEGIGIKPQEKPKIFDRYYRVESKHTTMVSGFGIGLYLCAEVVRLHNGRIWVESEVGRGSTFYFSLPV
ncbi:MAG: PAS domain S-box protein [Pedobacter sp.]|nr:MAG: PAS domain S-box protein [Pedobacter sp.]